MMTPGVWNKEVVTEMLSTGVHVSHRKVHTYSTRLGLSSTSRHREALDMQAMYG